MVVGTCVIFVPRTICPGVDYDWCAISSQNIDVSVEQFRVITDFYIL